MYLPILRTRPAEMNAISELSKLKIFSSQKIIPLIEIIQRYPNSRQPKQPKTFKDVYINKFKEFDFPIMVDIPMYVKVNKPKVKKTYSDFLKPILNSQLNRINLFNDLSSLNNLIPVISYNYNLPYINNIITTQENKLRNNFNILAFRIYTSTSTSILNEINSIIKKSDYLILDIDTMDHNDNNLTQLYKEMQKIKNSKGCTIILVRAAIANDFSNSQITNNIPNINLDNSLVKDYKNYGFDGFGDFAGIKKDLLEEGFLGFITTLFYYEFTTKYIGFTAKPSKSTKDFAVKIKPSILNSKYFKKYSPSHKSLCPGCIGISNISIQHPGNRATWKTIDIEHYIYSLYEIL